MCVHSWLFTDYCKICARCGLEEEILNLNQYNKFSAPLHRGYDRCSRFKIKLFKLYGRHAGPKVKDPVWGKLEALKHTLHNPKHIRKALRSLNLKNKHYDCIRIFSDIFTPYRVTLRNPLEELNTILFKFRAIHSTWKAQTPNEPFFSYDYLLRYLLNEVHSPLIIYCKPPTSKRRRIKYEKRLKVIRSHNAGKMCCHMPLVSRSRYGSMLP
jgi:hypothetical protein